jgi:hypothetical protein
MLLRRGAARAYKLVAGALVGLVTGTACSSGSPQELRRNHLLWQAARDCELELGTLRPERIDEQGRLEYTLGNGSEKDVPAFISCYREKAVQRLQEASPKK